MYQISIRPIVVQSDWREACGAAARHPAFQFHPGGSEQLICSTSGLNHALDPPLSYGTRQFSGMFSSSEMDVCHPAQPI